MNSMYNRIYELLLVNVLVLSALIMIKILANKCCEFILYNKRNLIVTDRKISLLILNWDQVMFYRRRRGTWNCKWFLGSVIVMWWLGSWPQSPDQLFIPHVLLKKKRTERKIWCRNLRESLCLSSHSAETLTSPDDCMCLKWVIPCSQSCSRRSTFLSSAPTQIKHTWTS